MITLNNKISVFHSKKKKCFKSGLSEAATRGALLKKSVLKNFTNYTGKHLCWSLFLIKLQTCNFIKKRLQHRYFPVKFAKFLTTSILKNICEWLLLNFAYWCHYSAKHTSKINLVALCSVFLWITESVL